MNIYKQEFMDRAIWLAGSSLRAGIRMGAPFGAVVVKDGIIIGEAFQQVLAITDPTAHAEILAIRQACQKIGSRLLPDCDLYASCCPCPMCLAAARWARISQIYYAADIGSQEAHNNADIALYEEMRNPNKGVKIESSAAHALETMLAWRKYFVRDV